jgi:hypothetical protein
MKKNRLLKVCGLARMILIVAGSVGSVSALGDTFIVKDGNPQAEIVVSKDAPRMAKLAAEELQTYLVKISGAKLPIANAPGKDVPVQIYVGRSADTDRLKITEEGLKNGAFRMVSGKNYLVLLGHDSDYTPKEPHLRNHGDMARLMADWDKITGEKWGFPLANLHKQYSGGNMKVWEKDERGSLNAVYEFLRMQGVRWYVPDPIGEIVPEKKSIALPEIDKTVRPDFAMRFPYQYFRMFSHEGTTRDELLWQLRLGLSQAPDLMGEHEMAGGHGINHVHSRDEIKKAHPEYFALFGDKRSTGPYAGAPCLSSEGLFQQNVKYVLAMFDLYDAPMVSVMPEDGYGTLCQCELCKGKGTPERGWDGQLSDYVWDYVNRVGKEVYKTHPNKKISCLAYGSYALPPLKIAKLSPNIVVGIAQARRDFYDTEKFNNAVALRRSWLAKLPEGHAPLWIWEYYLHNRPGSTYGALPVFFPHTIAKDLRSLKGISKGDFIEVYREQKGISELAVDHLNLYVTARLWWNADQDVNALLDEYYSLFYGPASKEMKAFIEYSEANWPLMAKKVEPIDKAFELLAVARAAAGDTIYGKRISWIQDYMGPLKQLRVKLAEGRKNVPQSQALRRDQKDIVINGKLDDKFWEGLPVYPLNDVESGKTPVNGGSFQIAYTGDALFLGITCKDSDMQNLNISTTKNGDANIWSGDNVELLFETPVHSYYQLTIGPSGALVNMDRKKGFNTLWVSHAEVATYRGKDFWSMEIRLPVAGELQEQLDPLNGIAGNLPSENNPWYFNVCRLRVRGSDHELTAFAPAGKKDFHVLLKFAELKGK